MRIELLSGSKYLLDGPVGDSRISSEFGPRVPITVRDAAGNALYRTIAFHLGVDLQADLGTPIEEIPAEGGISYAYDDDPRDSLGLVVRLQHDGYRTEYFHTIMGGWRPPNGFDVDAGQTFASVGMTGATTGPHLHLALRKDGYEHTYTNPAYFGSWTTDHIDPLGEEGLEFFNRGLVKEYTLTELRKAATVAISRGEYEIDKVAGKDWLVVETELS